MSRWFPSSRVSELFINHPQPPEHIDRGKATQSQNEGKHLLTSNFFNIVHRSLLPGGTVTIVTDNQSYARMLLRIICDDASLLFRPGIIEETDFIREDYSVTSSKVLLTSDADSIPRHTPPHLHPSHMTDTVEQADRFILWRGDPDSSVGHSAQSSSYFDRMWDKGQHSRRWILYIVAK
jgi:hypothetical protein